MKIIKIKDTLGYLLLITFCVALFDIVTTIGFINHDHIIHKVIGWAETMTWNGVHPAVYLVDKVYQKGVKLTKEAMKICEERIERLENLPKWDVTIKPKIW
jgi:hypothetical protein